MNKVKYYTTKKINEILNNWNYSNDKGKDYWNLKEDLQNELWEREKKELDKKIEQQIKEYNYE